MEIVQKVTRFRAYQLGNEGSSFSYCNGSTFTLIEARLTEASEKSLIVELKNNGKSFIDTLHITSWDNDHCKPNELEQILTKYRPNRIECPGYAPSTDSGIESNKMIQKYSEITKTSSRPTLVNYFTPEYYKSLSNADGFGYTNLLLHPKTLFEKSNDNSTVQLFRSGSFTVLSLGDVEHPDIAALLMNTAIVQTEVDVMLLAHHGADNGFTTDKLLKTIKPRVSVCSSNYDNKFEHPKQEIKDLLFQNGIRNFTTKTGDVIIKSVEPHTGDFKVINLVSDNEEISSAYDYKSKRLLP